MSEGAIARAGWTRVTFGDVVRQVKDKVDPEKSDLKRYVAGEHMTTDDLRIRRWGEIGDAYLGPAFHMRFKPGHVLYGSRRTYLRKVAVADFEGITANTTYVLEPKDPNVLLPELLPFIMQTDSFNQHSVQESKGSVNPYVNFSDLAWFEFVLPPIDEQQRIVWTLNAARSVGERLRELEIAAAEVVKAACVYLMHQDSLLAIDTATAAEVPNACRIVSFDQICERITYGFTNPMPTTSEGPWMVTAADVADGRINYRSARHTSQAAFDTDLTEKSRVRVGDVLLTKDGTLGRVAIVDRPNVCINQSVAVLRPAPEILPQFLAWTLRSPGMQRRLILDVGGSAVKHIYITKVASTRLLLPSLFLQEKLVATLTVLESQTLAVRSRVEQAHILSRLMLGRAAAVSHDI